MAQTHQIRIMSIARRQTPGGGRPYEWVGSGPIMEHDGWRATVALGGNAVDHARDALTDGKPYMLAIAPEDLVEFTIEAE